jgi:hypothetical protein
MGATYCDCAAPDLYVEALPVEPVKAHATSPGGPVSALYYAQCATCGRLFEGEYQVMGATRPKLGQPAKADPPAEPEQQELW